MVRKGDDLIKSYVHRRLLRDLRSLSLASTVNFPKLEILNIKNILDIFDGISAWWLSYRD